MVDVESTKPATLLKVEEERPSDYLGAPSPRSLLGNLTEIDIRQTIKRAPGRRV